MKLSIPPLDGMRFSRSHEDRTKIVAEASDFGRGGLKLYRLYDDACDIGIAVQGTRNLITFYLKKEHTRDGDVLFWEFEVISRDQKKSGGIRSAVIFND